LTARLARLAPFVVLAATACSAVLGVDFSAARLAPDFEGGSGTSGGVTADGCVPKTCATQSFECGTQDDGCGGVLECGTCDDAAVCSSGKCGCQPKTCPTLGAECGPIDDGCGHLVDCGKCANADDACAANKCSCQPKNCGARSATCGSVPDGCGNTYACGTCTDAGAPNCGGGGPNQCGPTPCTPLTCAGHCGDMSDGCGTVLHCPGCTPPDSCGSGGVANQCGCTPFTCAQKGAQCGTIPDGCGGTVDCGTCALPKTCAGAGVANQCGCVPNTCADFDCGIHPNGCGGSINCGSCACFPAGTRITMADGSTKAIERVVAGDLVRAGDPGTGQLGVARVAALKPHDSALSNGGIVVVDGTLRATRNHPIWANGRLVALEQVHVGDEVFVLAPNGVGTVKKLVQQVTVEPGGVPTYDLVLASSGHFIANGMMIAQKIQP
jgi:hypothetical protein